MHYVVCASKHFNGKPLGVANEDGLVEAGQTHSSVEAIEQNLDEIKWRRMWSEGD